MLQSIKYTIFEEMLFFRSNFEFEPWPYLNYQLEQLDLVTNQWLVSSFAQYHSKTKNNLK